MPSRLIINADDFGLTPGVNRAIAELHDAGVVTSATLMASGAAFEDAVALARARPGLGIGCHVVFTDGVPVSPPRAIPSLLASDGGKLRPKLLHFLAALFANQIDPAEIEREAIAQIQRLQEAGMQVTHLDTHKHTHLFPQVLKPLLRAAARTGVRAIRNPFEQPWAFPLSNGSTARTSQIRLLQPLKHLFHSQPALRAGTIRSTQGTIGISATGSLDVGSLRSLLAAMPDGTWELVCHPGYQDAALDLMTTRLRRSREVERDALLAVVPQAMYSNNHAQRANPWPPELIHYGDLFTSNDVPRETA